MKIGIANDHHGVILKQELTKYLESLGYTVVNYGTDGDNMVDYPDYAFKVGESIQNKNIDYGILICNTGIGMSIAANKVKNVRCAKVNNTYEAEMTRRDNDANMIAISSRLDIELIKEILKYSSIEIPAKFVKAKEIKRMPPLHTNDTAVSKNKTMNLKI